MFKIAKEQCITWPVTVSVPQDGGSVGKFKFDAKFVIVSRSRLDEIADNARAEGKDQDQALLAEVVRGFSGVQSEDGQPIDFSADALATLLDIPYVRVALLKAFFEASTGNAAARKN